VVSSQEARPQKSCCNISLAGLPELLGSPQLYHIFCVLLSSRNVASFSDGEPGKGTGVPYFYLTILDPTPTNAMKDPRSSFTISEYPLGTCGKVDPENPTCAKITLTGKLVPVDEKSKEAEFAQNALFTKHPQMKDWPKDHDFQIYKLVIEDIFLIDRFGGPEPLTVEEYLEAKM
ncbi:Protein CREG1, partial [Linum grandiflorum]